jgi:pimeloyl-ACP methyl ester carboxylesterase
MKKITHLYISGLGSVYKPYITDSLRRRFGADFHYYVLQNVFSTDLAYLEDYCRQAGPLQVTGHSTGGFLGLHLLRHFSNVQSLHLINPAIDLLWSLDQFPEAADFLKERPLMEEAFAGIMAHFRGEGHPVTMIQGELDEVVHTAFNKDFMQRLGGHTTLLPDLGHRFDEAGYERLMDLVQTHAQLMEKRLLNRDQTQH